MKLVKVFVMATMMMILTMQSASADEVAELKIMMQELKNNYESQIKALESRIGQIEQTQNQKVENLREEMTAEIEKKSIKSDYVGRHNAPVGDGGLMIGNPSGSSHVTLGGYVDMEYRDLNNSESTFRQHRLILNVGAQFKERIRFNSEIEYEYGGSDSAAGDGEIKVEQAYMDYLINDQINLRAGAILAPFGRYNLYHDSDLQDLTDRPCWHVILFQPRGQKLDMGYLVNLIL